MKSKMSVISCFLVCSVLVLPMTVCAEANVTAVTGSSKYRLGTLVDTYGNWTVSSQNWTKCNVHFGYRDVNTTQWFNYTGYYEPGVGGGGDVDVWCDDDEGISYYEWDSKEGWEDTWYVEVSVQLEGSPPDGGLDLSNYFVLWD